MENTLIQGSGLAILVFILGFIYYRVIGLTNEAKIGRILREKQEAESKEREIDEKINNSSLESLVEQSNKRHGKLGDHNP